MVDCGPSCAVPSCASTPTVGFGSAGGLGWGGWGQGGLGWGQGGLGWGQGGLGWGQGGRGYGAVESSGSLGTLAGVRPSCINQIPPAEVVIQPPPTVVTIPGPILSASCEPVSVGGNTPCAVDQCGYGGWGYGLGRRGFLRNKSLIGRRASTCGYPC
ncbi:keratin, type II cytoskeletal 1-like [Zootoca vivipara]|uniref:keratin, type II cytoskeletal 1-like n=1 Tax=Zootoca vivipara TaxID=8524 RepID=UPI001590A53E|nr:keratin, type II cytoskeletal 1-like [Zootoca vivipara]